MDKLRSLKGGCLPYSDMFRMIFFLPCRLCRMQKGEKPSLQSSARAVSHKESASSARTDDGVDLGN